MIKTGFFFLAFFLSSFQIFSEEYNINDLFMISIPSEIEVVSIRQALGVNNRKSRYMINNEIAVIYGNGYFVINMICYGSRNMSILNGSETLNMETGVFYAHTEEINYLKENYINRPITNNNGIRYGRFVSSWPSGTTADFYGLYFSLPNGDFD